MKRDVPLVLVEWDDAWGDATSPVTPQDAHFSHQPELIQTLGWVMLQNEKGIQLASEVCGDGSYRSKSFIPLGMIRSVTEYTLRKKHAPSPTSPAAPDHG